MNGSSRRWMAPTGLVIMGSLVLTGLVVVWDATPALADPGGPTTILAVESVTEVVDRIRAWLVGVLVSAATLFLTIGGLRYLAADGDPGEIERAKSAIRSAAIGYALASLAPLIVTVVRDWVA